MHHIYDTVGLKKIDESMIPYYGKHYAKQYIRGKPIRFGFKNWALISANGCMGQFDIYMGKTAECTPKGFGVGGDKVLDLLSKANVHLIKDSR